jgi:hypothetical protein
LVTHLPPALFGFRHVGQVLQFGKSKGLIRDHYPEEYTATLQSLKTQEGEPTE